MNKCLITPNRYIRVVLGNNDLIYKRLVIYWGWICNETSSAFVEKFLYELVHLVC